MAITYQGCNIVIVGGSQGIGRAVAIRLAKQKANLFVIARNLSHLNSLKKEIKGFSEIVCKTYQADVSRLPQLKKVIKQIVKDTNQRIDGVIHNVGFAHAGYFDQLAIGLFEKSMQNNYLSGVYTAKLFVPYLKEGSFLTFTSSVAGYLGIFGFSAYSPTKFALIGFATVLQQELGPKKIHISVLCPPDTDTPGYAEEDKTKPYETKKLANTASLMTADQVAKVFLKKLRAKKFLITCNLSSRFYYWIHNYFPNLFRKIVHLLIWYYQRKSHEK